MWRFDWKRFRVRLYYSAKESPDKESGEKQWFLETNLGSFNDFATSLCI